MMVSMYLLSSLRLEGARGQQASLLPYRLNKQAAGKRPLRALGRRRSAWGVPHAVGARSTEKRIL